MLYQPMPSNPRNLFILSLSTALRYAYHLLYLVVDSLKLEHPPTFSFYGILQIFRFCRLFTWIYSLFHGPTPMLLINSEWFHTDTHGYQPSLTWSRHCENLESFWISNETSNPWFFSWLTQKMVVFLITYAYYLCILYLTLYLHTKHLLWQW